MSRTGKIIAIAKAVGVSAREVSQEIERQLPGEVSDWLGKHITNPNSPPLDRSLTQSNAATPADITGELKSAFNVTITPVEWAPKLVRNAYISSGTGILTGGASAKYACTSAIQAGNGTRIAINLASNVYEYRPAFYDSTGNLGTGAGYLGAREYVKGLTYIPEGVALFGLTFRRIDQAYMTSADIEAIEANLIAYAPTDTTLTKKGIAADAKETGRLISKLSQVGTIATGNIKIDSTNRKVIVQSQSLIFPSKDTYIFVPVGEYNINANTDLTNAFILFVNIEQKVFDCFSPGNVSQLIDQNWVSLGYIQSYRETYYGVPYDQNAVSIFVDDIEIKPVYNSAIEETRNEIDNKYLAKLTGINGLSCSVDVSNSIFTADFTYGSYPYIYYENGSVAVTDRTAHLETELTSSIGQAFLVFDIITNRFLIKTNSIGDKVNARDQILILSFYYQVVTNKKQPSKFIWFCPMLSYGAGFDRTMQTLDQNASYAKQSVQRHLISVNACSINIDISDSLEEGKHTVTIHVEKSANWYALFSEHEYTQPGDSLLTNTVFENLDIKSTILSIYYDQNKHVFVYAVSTDINRYAVNYSNLTLVISMYLRSDATVSRFLYYNPVVTVTKNSLPMSNVLNYGLGLADAHKIEQNASDIALIKNNASVRPFPSKTFMRVGCIGDSYTSGYIKLNDDIPAISKNANYAWPKFMEILTGRTWTNFGVSGSTAKGWVTGHAGLSDLQAQGNKCQAYVIGLMINDQSDDMPYRTPCGEITDIGTDNDTYYAWYYKLIVLVAAINSDAKIFCNTCPKVGGNFAQYNQAVRDIVSYCHDTMSMNVYLCDLADTSKYFNSNYYTNPVFVSDAVRGHYTAIGYEFMAECYLRVLSDVMSANISEFQNIYRIPYDAAEET